MSYPLSHKTVIVLDHGSDFLASSQQMIDLDQITKTRTLIPLAPISKSLWNCSVESSVEYCRIVWDIFPSGRLIRFVIGDGEDTRFLNSWSEQSVSQVMTAFGRIPPPSTGKNKLDIVRAVEMALGTLCEPSEIQHERRTNLDLQTEVVNRGRVIVITQLQGETETLKLEKKLNTTLDIVNKVATQDDKQIPLQEVEIILIHTSPGTKEISIAHTHRKYGAILTIEAHKVTSGYFLSEKLCELVQGHYDLAITTVTGIPMKEEQNANSSANYDVELLHPAAAHSDFKADQGEEKHEVTLKWCTPRSAPAHELQYCTAAFRITPVDINSRPSSCLTNFLLGGRTVMLELPRKSGSKLLSHMLASHGGEIYIHTLGTGRSALEDPPSISEGTGGRVTDYRITDFGTFMKDHTLVPYDTSKGPGPETPLELTLANIARTTLYWPLVISSTSVYNVQSHLEPLLSIIVKPNITQDQVVECKKVILNMMHMETKGAALPLSSGSAGPRGKSGLKKEEQYRALWTELEQLVRLYCSTAEHQQVLECLLECKKSETVSSLDPPKSVILETKSSFSIENQSPSEDIKPKKLRVAPDLLGKTSLLGLIKDNMSRKPATSMWMGYNPETKKTQLYQNVKDKVSREENVPMEIP